MRTLFVILIPILYTSLYGQPKQGIIEVTEDDKITKLVSKHIRINDSLGTMAGFRIQLIFTSGVNGKKLAQEVETDFIKKYPDTKSYLIWDSPNYKVRIGDFRTRLDALKFQDQIKDDFPSGYIVQDDINLKEIK